MWLNNKYKFKQDTLKSVAKNYSAASFTKDFSDPDTPYKIADWISENISGKFRPELRIEDSDLELMKIINTVTFIEKWTTKFSNARTDTFHLKNGEEIQCDFLKKTTDYEISVRIKHQLLLIPKNLLSLNLTDLSNTIFPIKTILLFFQES